MSKKIILLPLVLGVSMFAQVSKQEAELVKSVIPTTKVDKVEKSRIDGLYEAYMPNGQILHVHPFSKTIVFGELWTNNGQNITAQNQDKWSKELESKQIENISADELLKDTVEVKYGKGSNVKLVLFTDPECPYCKNVENFVKNKDVTVHYSLLPLPFHKNAQNWSLYALSSKDFKQALLDIEEGKIDESLKHSNEAKEMLEKMKEKAKKLGVNGTPKIYVVKEGKVIGIINGANIPELEKILSEGGKQ